MIALTLLVGGIILSLVGAPIVGLIAGLAATGGVFTGITFGLTGIGTALLSIPSIIGGHILGMIAAVLTLPLWLGTTGLAGALVGGVAGLASPLNLLAAAVVVPAVALIGALVAGSITGVPVALISALVASVVGLIGGSILGTIADGVANIVRITPQGETPTVKVPPLPSPKTVKMPTLNAVPTAPQLKTVSAETVTLPVQMHPLAGVRNVYKNTNMRMVTVPVK